MFSSVLKSCGEKLNSGDLGWICEATGLHAVLQVQKILNCYNHLATGNPSKNFTKLDAGYSSNSVCTLNNCAECLLND